MEDLYCIKKVILPENILKIVKIINLREHNVFYAPLTCSSPKEFIEGHKKSLLKFTNERLNSKFHQSPTLCLARNRLSEAVVYLNGELMKSEISYALEDGANVEIKYPDFDEKVTLFISKVDAATDLENLLAENDKEKELTKAMESRINGNDRALEIVRVYFHEMAYSLETEREKSKSLRDEIEHLQMKQTRNSGESVSDKLAPVNDQIQSIISRLQPLQINVEALSDECKRVEHDRIRQINSTAKENTELKAQLEERLVEIASHTSKTNRLRDELNESQKGEKKVVGQMNNMFDEIEILKERLRELLYEKAHESSEVSRLHDELNECKKVETDKRREIISMQEQNEVLNQQLKKLPFEMSRLRDELKQCKIFENQKLKEINSMEEENQKLKQHVTNLCSKIANHSSESSRLRDELKVCKTVEYNKSIEINSIAKENRELKQQLKKLSVDLSTHSSESIRLRNELKESKKVEIDKRREMNIMARENKELKHQLQARYDDIARDTAELIRLLDKLKARKEESVKMKKQFNTEKDSFLDTLSKQKSSYLEVWNQLGHLQSKLKQSLADELECTICNDIVKSPLILNCAHTFCSTCITTWKATKNDCPTCRQHIVQLVPNLILKNIIEMFRDELYE